MGEDAISDTEQLTAERADRAPLKVRVIAGPDLGAELTLERGTYRVGKAADCELRLSDRAVSRTHLTFEVLPKGVRVVDNRSTNGTFCQGVRISEAIARAGTTLQLGRTALKLVSLDEPPAKVAKRTSFGRLVGRGAAMQALFAELERIAQSDVSVLIEGETGTGKDLCAEAIHAHSRRFRGPWVVVDLAAVGASLFESELFGHKKGSFTGAIADRVGAFERACGGTLFLDEVGELPLEVQPRLLRALERKEVRRVGGDAYIEVDVRVVAATHRRLEDEVHQQRFRADLFHRLAVARVRLPPLRERPEDIPLLVEALLERMGQPPNVLSEETVAIMCDHAWPGNVRELRNVVERAVLLGEPPPGSAPKRRAPVAGSFHEAKERIVRAFERDFLTALLERCGGNLSATAREAGIDRGYLRRLMRRHHLEVKKEA